jgi:peptidase C39-like protein
MHRRKFLSILSATYLTGCAGQHGSFFWGVNSFQCAKYETHLQPNRIRLRRFDKLDLKEQEGTELCWAAAIQAVLRYHGKNVSQSSIVKKVRGASDSKNYSAATLKEIIRGISGRWTSWHINNGNSFTLVSDLNNLNPVLIGLEGKDEQQGHIVVAYGVEYFMDLNRILYIDRVKIWDPWFGEGSKWIDGCELKDKISFALHSWAPGDSFQARDPWDDCFGKKVDENGKCPGKA